MEDLTTLQTLVVLGIAAINGVVIANALLDVYVRPPAARFFFPKHTACGEACHKNARAAKTRSNTVWF